MIGIVGTSIRIAAKKALKASLGAVFRALGEKQDRIIGSVDFETVDTEPGFSQQSIDEVAVALRDMGLNDSLNLDNKLIPTNLLLTD